jgi:GxxExxY protein
VVKNLQFGSDRGIEWIDPMAYGENTSPEIERIATAIVDAAFKVHSQLGPGLLESVYECCLEYELGKRGLRVERQVAVPIIYDGTTLDAALKLDLLIEEKVVIEIKAVEKHNALFEAQVMTYLKLSGKRLGILINFNVKLIKDGIKRIVL